jgi:hypothetical protein
MTRTNKRYPQGRVATMQWVARLGAVTAEALADHDGSTVAAARGRLAAGARDGLLAGSRPLAGQPTLYAVTRAGVRASGLHGLDSCRISTANAQHAIVCSRVAAALERCYPEHRVLGERELRRDERDCGAPLASARVGLRPDGGALLHRPDLVLWPAGTPGASEEISQLDAPDDPRPIAVEVELTVKAPQRLLEICRAWARARCVAGVLYLCSPEAGRALHRAIENAQAETRIVVVELESLPRRDLPSERTVPAAT